MVITQQRASKKLKEEVFSEMFFPYFFFFFCKVVTDFQNPALCSTDIILCPIFTRKKRAAIAALLPVIRACIHIMLYSLTNLFCQFLNFLSHSPHWLSQATSHHSLSTSCPVPSFRTFDPFGGPEERTWQISFSEMSKAELREIRKLGSGWCLKLQFSLCCCS